MGRGDRFLVPLVVMRHKTALTTWIQTVYM
jgi:hypothetical protein